MIVSSRYEPKHSGRKDRFRTRSQRGGAATTEGDRSDVSAYGRVGENDVVKPRSPERTARENARSSMSVEQRSQSMERLSERHHQATQ